MMNLLMYHIIKFLFAIFPEQCIKALISKGLGLAIVAGSCMVKVPQILKIMQNKSAAGVSFTSVLFDLYAVVAGVAYAYAKQFPFSAWGDALFLLIQSTIITALVLGYNFSPSAAASFVVAFCGVLVGLIGGFTSLDVLWSMQAVSAPIMFVGK
ncbi:mannose-P-dolichol utilization defect 1 protein homolog, partial [Nilaparvata lugens]|uniref:mannose-P-dolichol utilization defect 1 protein homolog n=1 Tax=Nilaparvata lugens TaxID=108931 RepID=UPI00193E8069